MRGTLDHSVFAFGGRARPYAACAFPSREQYSTARISISQWMEIDDAAALTGLAVIIMAVGSVTTADAKGCLKGAVVGGVAGHYAGHRWCVGAAAGCLISDATKRTSARGWKTGIIAAAEAARTTAALRKERLSKVSNDLSNQKRPRKGPFLRLSIIPRWRSL